MTPVICHYSTVKSNEEKTSHANRLPRYPLPRRLPRPRLRRYRRFRNLLHRTTRLPPRLRWLTFSAQVRSLHPHLGSRSRLPTPSRAVGVTHTHE